jgi:fibronectin-binding autotransporter adhesin
MKTLVSRGGKNVLAMAAMAVACTAAFGVTKTYIGTTTGHFNVAGNWSPSGAPADGDDVVLGTTQYNATDDLDVTLDTNEPVGNAVINTYNSLTLDSAGLLGFMVLNQTAGTLSATTETIGKTTAENTFNQDEGTTNTVQILNIGVAGSSDTYNLSGNSSNTTLGALQMNVGISGSGTFNQTGGIVTQFIDPTITLGVNSGGFGTINLSGSQSQSEFEVGILSVGSAGSGVFNQSGGEVDAEAISISSTSGTAIYNYSGGALTLSTDPIIQVGNNGTFNLETGAVLTAAVSINGGGAFRMGGGSFDPTAIVYMNGGSFELQGHSGTLSNLSGPTINNSGTVLGAGNIFNGAATSAALTVDMPYTGSSQTAPGQIVQFGGNIFNGAAGSFGLAVTGGAGFGLGLSGSSNTYSGSTTVAATLEAFTNGAFSPNSAVTMQTGGVLDASTFAVSIGSLAGTAGTVNVDTGGSLSIGADNTSTTYAGVLTGGGTITKIDNGTLTLNTSGDTFTGPINIQSGTLAVGVTNGIPTNVPVNFTGITGTLSVNANQTLASYSAGDLDSTTFSNNSTLTVGTNNVSSTIGGNFTGTGTLAIAGTGTYFLGSGAGDTVPNQDASVTLAVNSGATLDLNKNPGTIAAAGPLAINGGTVILSASNQIASTSIVNFAGGTLNLNGFSANVGGLVGSIGNVALNGGTLTIAASSNTSYAGSLTGPGSFIKTLAGNFTLAGASTYNGTFTATGGQLTLQNAVSASAVTANTGATVEFNTAAFNGFGAQILANSGSVIEYLGSTISNAFLRGTHTILAGATSTFNGITTFNSTVITQNGPAVFNNFSNGGTINNNAALTFSGATNAGTGIININNALSTQDFGNEGVMNIAVGATLTNSVSDLYLEGGSRTYIGTTTNHGGTVTLQGGTTFEVNGALLVNDGTISGTTDVNYGGTAEGVGTYGPVNVTFGGVFQPGISSTVVLANNNTQVSALSGDGTIDNVAATGNITLNVNTSIANSFTGTIQNSNGTLGLNLNGGSLTLLTHPIAGGNSINTYTGGTTITSGSLIIGATGAFPIGTPVLNNGSFFIYANSTTGQITGNGQLTVGSVATGNAVATIAPKSGLSTLASLTITTGSKLDLTNNDLVIHTGSFAQIVSQLAQGYSHGTWAGSTGIASSVASLIANHATTLGVATGLTTFDGQSVLPSDVLIKYTWLGDANLDGIVNSADLAAISTTGTTWQTGDFNYDSQVNADDYALFMLGAAHGSSTNISATLPEPGVMLALGGLLCLRRARKA